jgi:hypothetical protein
MRLQPAKMLVYVRRMKLRFPRAAALLIPFLIAASTHASSGGASASPTPTLLDETLTVLHLKHRPGAAVAGQMHDGIAMKIAVDPEDFKLSENREIKVTVTLLNPSSKKYVHLNFPTSQRVEILVRDGAGKVVNTWSEDQSFTNDPASVTINPGERLEYSEQVATREMAAGQPYSIEVSFPSYPDLKIADKVTPEK